MYKYIWSILRKRKIIHRHARVARYCDQLIADYAAGTFDSYAIKPKAELNLNKIIWQYWGQGIEDACLPEVVQACFDSVDRHSEGYTVIRLTDETISKYIEFPDFVYDKLANNPSFTHTFFSDLLRVALLHTYGGVWLDATIYLSSELPNRLSDSSYFMFQRDSNEVEKYYWENSYSYYWGWYRGFKVNVLNSIIVAEKEDVVIQQILAILLQYWKKEDYFIDYFLFQILYDQLVNGSLKNEKCAVVSDVLPHLIQTQINGGRYFDSFAHLLSNNTIHKMTYYTGAALDKFRAFDQYCKSLN